VISTRAGPRTSSPTLKDLGLDIADYQCHMRERVPLEKLVVEGFGLRDR